jgi:probable rRNA maturation factor
MILLDPDLDRDHAASRAQHPAVSSRAGRLPSVRSLSLFLRRAQALVKLRGEVSVLLTTDAAIRKLNRRFRGKDKATDVLSFPAGTPPRNQKAIAGDLAISVETAERQGAASGHSLATEIKILMLHGLLHLRGYDHEHDAGEMQRRERALRARLGLAQGLIERNSSPTLATEKSRKDGARGFRVAQKGRTAGPSTSSAAADFARGDSKNAGQGAVPPHPGRKNKNAARVGHPPSRVRRARRAR